MKKSKYKGVAVLTLLFSILIILAGCGTAEPAGGKGQASKDQASNDGQKSEVIRVGYFPNLDHAAAIIGLEKGFFQQELDGVKIETQIFPNGSLFMDALNTDQIDIGYVGPGPAMGRFVQGGDVVMLGSAANGATLVVARADSGINSTKDLNGKTFASPAIGCTHDVQLETSLLKEGLTSERIGGTLKHITQKPANMIGLFEQKQIDVATVPEPWGSLMEEQLGAKVVMEWDEVAWGTTLPSVVVVSSKKFVQEHSDLVDKFLTAHVGAIQYMKENPDETLKIMAAKLEELTKQKLSETVMKKAWGRMNVSYELDSGVLQEFADSATELKFYKERPNLDGLVELSHLERVLAK